MEDTMKHLQRKGQFVFLFIAVCALLATGRIDWEIGGIAEIGRRIFSQGNTKEPMHTSTPSTEYFSPDYATAKKRFLAAAQKAGAHLEMIELPQKTPEGKPLTIDIAWLGTINPSKVLLHTSGLHGVEGFAGSAIQLKLLEHLWSLPEDTALILVHALNPYGMAWLRRFNESNVDLNRNYAFTEQLLEKIDQKQAAYAELNGFLNPRTHSLFDSFYLQVLQTLWKGDLTTLKQTIAGGQSWFPQGVFYTGRNLEPGIKRYLDWLQTHLSPIQRLIVIDVHTGLGRWGQETLFHKVADTKSRKLEKQLEKTLIPGKTPSEVKEYAFAGGHSVLLREALPAVQLDFIAQEFGTYSNIRILQALREENRDHHWKNSHPTQRSKKNLHDAFAPTNTAWRQSVVQAGNRFVSKAMESLSHP